MSFEIVHKPTFTNQLLAIPKERVVQVLVKVERLGEDPRPHGDLKKKLHGYEDNVYRLRSGDYRVLYTYGDGWVTLLGLEDRKDIRKDIYRGDRLLAEELEEALLRERRTLYVAMTRAMRALLVALPANGAGAGNEAAPLFGGFDDDHWNVGSGALA